MTLRNHITNAMLTHAPIPAHQQNTAYPWYYARYEDNLFSPLGEQALEAYDRGSGAETRPTAQRPAKMASIASSSAMTFNLLGNGPVHIHPTGALPSGFYQVQFEKQLYTLGKGSKPAHLDAFLSDEQTQTAVFCEMKLLEWLNTPGSLKESYTDKAYYFASDDTAVSCPLDAYAVFQRVIESVYQAGFRHYDTWQMVKHLLAVYNHTSFTTQAAVNAREKLPSMAGRYRRIVLANVVNEFPSTRIVDPTVRAAYTAALEDEQREAAQFINIIRESDIPHLFDNHCNAGINVTYITAKDVADSLDMSAARRTYLKRYFE